MILTIDKKICDIEESVDIPISYDADNLGKTTKNRGGRSLVLTIPLTQNNIKIVGCPEDLHNASIFNSATHFAEISQDHATLLAGEVVLMKSSKSGFTLRITTQGSKWARDAAQRMFNTIPIAYFKSLAPLTVLESWTDSSPVKFFPIDRDEYPQSSSATDLLPAERLLTIGDYHPFIQVKVLFEKIIDGYTIESQFMESELFKSLYISGAYSSTNTENIENRMGFRARRSASTTATADHVGRVYASHHPGSSRLGNIVDTATPNVLDQEGEMVEDVWNNGHCFRVEEGKIVFRPLTGATAAFEYYIKYTTDHRIKSRKTLTGFDSIYLGEGGVFDFSLANRYNDRRGDGVLNRNFKYTFIVFNHNPHAQYRLTYTRNGVVGVTWRDFTERSVSVVTDANLLCSKPVLKIKQGSGWVVHQGDWALYDGYITEYGKTTVEMKIKGAPEVIAPTSPKLFAHIHFEGAEQGMKLTLDKQTAVRSIFSSSPGYGSMIRFADIAQHQIRQIKLIESIQHLFNLRFYTDEQTKTVYIEPYDMFFERGKVFDLTHKIDHTQTVEVSDLAVDVYKERTFAYLDYDGQTRRLNQTSQERVGEWVTTLPSAAAKEGSKRFTNPLFSPSQSVSDVYFNAPAAQILKIGDRDLVEPTDSISPRIVRYLGMHPLPVSQEWGYPHFESTYPLAAFHFKGDEHKSKSSLYFEDRDGAAGLHSFYDQQIDQETRRHKIALSLSLEPHEVESMLTCGTSNCDVRSIYKFIIDEQAIYCTLHSMGVYNPTKKSTTCVFTRLNQDQII